MEIRNEVKQKDQEVEKKKFVVRNAADIQRAKLEKLMKNPDKPVMIPAPSKNRDFSTAIPSFVRNVMGSSAGAGSGEFHVYRHLRRKEYARQKQIQEKSHAEQLDDAFQQKLENNRKAAEERTAKKRAKRLKKKSKQKAQQRGKKPKLTESGNDMSEDSSEEQEEEEPVGTLAQDANANKDETQKDTDCDKEQHETDKSDDTTGKEDETTQLPNQGTENSASPSEANTEDQPLESGKDSNDRPNDTEENTAN